MQQRIGFIGIGLMGKPMTLRLLQAGYQVNVWNRSPEKVQAVVDRGATAMPSVAELVQASDIILLCLANTEVVEQVVFGSEGVAAHGASNKLLLDLSSIEPAATREFAQRLHQACSMSWVDAPVSGGVPGAEQGTLAVMCGGRSEDVERVRPVLEPLSQRVTHMGEVGAGQVTKVCNQMIVGCNALVIAEMMALAQASGVAAEKIPEALSGGFADSKPLQILGPQMAQDDFEPPKWHVRTLLKDLDMAVQQAQKLGSGTPMSGLGAQLMRLHGSKGYLDKDPSTLIKMFRD